MAESTFKPTSVVPVGHVFKWTIPPPHFQNLFDAASSNPDENAKKFAKAEFTVGGESIGIPTKWQFYLKQVGDWVSIYLEFLGPGSYRAKYEVYDNTFSKEFISVGKQPTQRYATAKECAKIEGTVFETGCSLGSVYELFGKLEVILEVIVYYPSGINFKGDLSTDLKNGLVSGPISDVTFEFVEEEGSQNVIAEVKANKSILSFRSPVFAKMFASGMKEATEGKVKISDMTPKAMEIFLNFMYTGVVDPEWISVAEELIRVTHKYELDKFLAFLSENIFFALTPRNALRIRELGDLYKLPKIVETAMKFMKDNFEDIFNLHKMILKEEEELKEVD